jgi:hypothetical protein
MPQAPLLRAAALALLLALPLAGCVLNTSGSAGGEVSTADEAPIETGTAPPPPDVTAPATDASGQPLVEQPLSSAPVSAAEAGTPGEVDYSCTTDADCAVKDVGNCCGYYPACVNKDSPTFPEQVKAECAKNDMQSVCGFRDIQGCACVEGRCEAGPATSGEAVR